MRQRELSQKPEYHARFRISYYLHDNMQLLASSDQTLDKILTHFPLSHSFAVCIAILVIMMA